MLPSIRVHPRGRAIEKFQNAAFKVFEENGQDASPTLDFDLPKLESSQIPVPKVFGPDRNNVQKQTPSPALTKNKRRQNGNHLCPNREFLRSPFQDLKTANTPSSKNSTPVKSVSHGSPSVQRVLFLSARRPDNDLPSPGKLLQRSFHGRSRSPRDVKQNRSRSNSFLCRSLFGKTYASPTSESNPGEGCSSSNNPKRSIGIDNSGSSQKNVLEQPSSSDGLKKSGSIDAPFDVLTGRSKSPSHGNKALLNDAFIESISRVFSPDELDSCVETSSRKGKGGGSQLSGGGVGGGGGRNSGVLTSSPRCVVVKPSEGALSSPGDGSANSSSQNNSSGTGSGNGSRNGNGSGSGSGSGIASVASGDHLLGVLDTVVDLSPVPHVDSCIVANETSSVCLSAESTDPTTDDPSPFLGLSYSDREFQTPSFYRSSVSSASSVPTGSVPGRRCSQVSSTSSRDFVDLTGNIEESSIVALRFSNKYGPGITAEAGKDREEEESHFVRVIRGESISLKAVQQCDIVVTELLGSGGFGKVFLGKWFDMDLAIKVLSGKLIKSAASNNSGSNWQDCYASEKKILNLKHTNIVRTLAMSQRNAYPNEPIYIIQEYGGGRNLNQVIESTVERFSLRRLLRFLKHVVSGLHYIHSNGIIHMDVKPANIIITSRNVPKIADFGCCISALKAAKANADPSKAQMSLHVPGTPGYTAPELFCGARATKKCDIYSLAICLWQLWTWGMDPYPGLKQPHVLIYCVVKSNRRPVWSDEDERSHLEFHDEYVKMTELNWDKEPKMRQNAKQVLKFIKKWGKKINV